MTARRSGPALAVGGETTISGGGPWARATVDAPPEAWASGLTAARDELGCDFFDWLPAVDESQEGYAIVAPAWSTTGRYGVLLRSGAPCESPALASIAEVYPGAAWHERETHEMFGVDFPGHPNLVFLLLPTEFERATQARGLLILAALLTIVGAAAVLMGYAVVVRLMA
jgi:NADH:ubiquinone oxidoreductase subunit C